MDFSIRSLRTLKAEASAGRSKGRTAGGAENKKEDRMSEVVRAVREVVNQNGQSAMKINDIVKAIAKNRSFAVGQVDRDELVGVLNHYKKLQIIYIDQDENVIFL